VEKRVEIPYSDRTRKNARQENKGKVDREKLAFQEEDKLFSNYLSPRSFGHAGTPFRQLFSTLKIIFT